MEQKSANYLLGWFLIFSLIGCFILLVCIILNMMIIIDIVSNNVTSDQLRNRYISSISVMIFALLLLIIMTLVIYIFYRRYKFNGTKAFPITIIGTSVLTIILVVISALLNYWGLGDMPSNVNFLHSSYAMSITNAVLLIILVVILAFILIFIVGYNIQLSDSNYTDDIILEELIEINKETKTVKTE